MKTPYSIKLILILISVLTFRPNLKAQEEIVPFDSNNRIYKLTPELEKKLNIYKGEGRFVDAELFKQNDSTYFVEYHYSKQDKVFRTRIQLDAIQVQDLRIKIDQAAKENIVTEESSSEGRNFLLTACLFSGLTTYGPALPIIVNPKDYRYTLGLYMLGAGTSFFLPYFLTKDKPLSYGQANLVYYGLSRGFVHGVLFDLTVSKSAGVRDIYLSGTLFGITESLLGYNLVKKYNIDNGTANLMTVYGDFGFFTGIALANQFDLLNSGKGHAISALVLSGSIGGLFTGYFLGKDKNVSAGDAEIISTTGWLGAYLPYFILADARPKQDWLYTTPSLLTGIAGLYIGHQLVKNYNFTFTQGYSTKLGTIAGGLIGLGLTYVIVERPSATQALFGSYLGAQASFILLHNLNLHSLRTEALNKFHLEFTPGNLLLAKYYKPETQAYNALPLIKLSCKF